MTSKAQRQNRIVNLIQSQHIASQTQLTQLLENEGIISTQATISRDLEEIGVVKVNLADGTSAYAIIEQAKRPGADGTLAKTLKQYVIGVEAVPPMVVIKTPVGCADVTCAALDSAKMPEIVGTLAGQDTIMVVLAADVDHESFVNKIAELSDLNLG